MFSEENIERTKERLVEYVKDNKDSFTRKGDVSVNNYWKFTNEELYVKPIEDAMEVFGATGAIDIIVKTLNDIHGVSGGASYQVVKPEETTEFTTDEYDKYEVYRSADSPSLLYEWFTPTNVKSDKKTDEDYYDDYDEDDYGYDEDYFDDDDDTLNQSTNEPKDKNELLTGLKDLDDQISILQSMGFLSHAWRDDRDESEVSDNEMVNHPPHYNQGKFETIDIIEDIVAGYDDPVEAYLVGTTLKYLARAPFKGAKKQDLEKAVFYLKRAIDKQQ